MKFLSEDHALNFQNMILKDRATFLDKERGPLFYILGGNEILFKNRNLIYNFQEHTISKECLEKLEIEFCSSEKALVRLGLNLYDGYQDELTSPTYILRNLSEKDLFLALKAMEYAVDNTINEISEEYEFTLYF